MVIYAEIYGSMQQFGGTCPDGWVEVASSRPDSDDYVATAEGQWIVRPADQVYWLNDEEHILKYPDVLPEGASFEKPLVVANAERIAEIKDLLMQNDLASIRPLRAINDGTATDFDRTKLAELEVQAQALRNELAELSLIPE